MKSLVPFELDKTLRDVELFGASPPGFFVGHFNYPKLKKNYDENPAMGMELAVEELRTNFGAVVNEDDLLILRFTSKNPEKAAEITNAYIEELDHFNKEMNITNAKRNRIFLEERVHQVQLDLSAAEDSLRSFQETHKIIALEEEIAMAIQSYAELKAQLIESEIQLGILQQHSTHNNPQIALLKNQIRELEKQLKQMQTATDSTSIGKNELGFTIPFDDVPEVGLELIRLTREMEIQNRVYAFLLEQYEQAKIQEAKDTPTVQILDYAVPPGKKSWPPRTLIILTSALIAAILSLVLVLLLEFWQDIQSQDKYKELRKLLEIIKKDLSWLPFIK